MIIFNTILKRTINSASQSDCIIKFHWPNDDQLPFENINSSCISMIILNIIRKRILNLARNASQSQQQLCKIQRTRDITGQFQTFQTFFLHIDDNS